MTIYYILMRVIILLVTLFSCLYGLRQIQKGITNKYFMIVLYAMISILFSRIYYFALILSNGSDNILTIGTFGQAAAYLFFLIANTRYLSKEFTKKLRTEVNYVSVLGLLLLFVSSFVSTMKINTLSSYVGGLIYFVTMGNTLYTALAVVTNKNKIKECSYVYNFNICVILLIVFSAILELLIAFASGTIVSILYLVLVVSTITSIALMLPLLKKGVIEWKQ